MPLVSTLICTFNAENFLEPTIKSVLAQTHRDQEILIRDDCSSDNTLVLLKEWADKDSRITIYSEPAVKRWPYWWLNHLLDMAQWEYIAIQDHDDLWHPEKLEQQVNFLQNNKEYEWCGSYYTLYLEKFEKLSKRNKIWTTYGKVLCHHTSLMYRKTTWRYNTNLKRFIDLDFMLNTLGNIYELPEVYMLHRERADWNNLFSKRSSGLKNGLKLREFQPTPIKFIYYVYRSIVWEAVTRRLSVHFFSRNKYTTKENTTHKRIHYYL